MSSGSFLRKIISCLRTTTKAHNANQLNEPTEILASVANGDKSAFQQLYQLFGDKVYHTALSYVQNVQDAEEVTQDVFTNMYRSAAKFKGTSSVSTWVYRITVNASLNFIKKKKRFAFLKFGQVNKDTPHFEHPGILLENKENAKILFKIIDTLPDNQKTAFILSFVEDLPRKEVAEIMDTSLKAVESLLQRAKKKLRKKLEKLYPHRRKNK